MERPTTNMWSASSSRLVSTTTSILIMILISATTFAISTVPASTTIAISASDSTTTTTAMPQINQASTTVQVNKTRSMTMTRQQRLGSSTRRASSSRNKPTTLLPITSPYPLTTSQPIADYQDPMLVAQQEARLMAGYRNTPPVLITHTRDLFVDVAKYPLGTRLVTLKASDQEADPVLYSLQPSAYLNQDASPYLSIEPLTGELKLANRMFPFQINQTQSVTTNTNCDGEEDCPDEIESSSFLGEFNERTSRRRQMFGRNIYFLNVMVSDSQYNTTTEFLVHVINSTYLALSLNSDSSSIRLMPRFNDRPSLVGRPSAMATKQDNFDQLESIIHQKTEDFYNRLLNVSSSIKSDENDEDDVRPAVVYPNFVNPSLTRPDLIQDDGVASQVEELSTMMPSSSSSPDSAVSGAPKNLIAISETVAAESKGPSASHGSKDINVVEPMVVSMVVFCSCLLIMLVLLLFLVPISVKRLRRRIRHVERQHEQLSQKNSFSADSSIMGHSTVGGSSLSNHQVGQHHPSLSDFSSSVSTSSNCCKSLIDHQQRRPKPAYRQSSLDSSTQQPILSHDTHRMIIQNQAFLMMPPDQCQFMNQQPGLGLDLSLQQVDNIYCPIDDELYSTIGVNHHLEQQQNLNFSHDFQEAVSTDRNVESPASIESGSSTRSLARFLSLPARHAAHNNSADDAEEDRSITRGRRALDELDCIFKQEPQQPLAPVAKTIARASHISREQRQAKLNEMFVCQTPVIDWELERHRLRFLEILDEGQFGQVWRCKLKHENNQSKGGTFQTEQTVAVKTLKNSAGRSGRQREELLMEIENMKLVYGHPNVVKILHCCSETGGISEKPILLVMEYVELGKLQSYLENSRLNHRYTTNLYNNLHATSDHLTSRDLVKFIYHVAKGMEFVAHKGIVHRDLASRNVLVSAQRICKIGDFGMARNTASQTDGVYERHSRNTKIPVRWMAPEVLLSNSFTTKSDVYSFGILMWEIVTLGSTPYRHLRTEQVIDEVARKGQRPTQPDYCHKLLFDIMSRCWQESPKQRPTFSRLVKQLDELLLSSNDYIELDQYPDHNYYNIPKTVAPYELL